MSCPLMKLVHIVCIRSKNDRRFYMQNRSSSNVTFIDVSHWEGNID